MKETFMDAFFRKTVANPSSSSPSPIAGANSIGAPQSSQSLKRPLSKDTNFNEGIELVPPLRNVLSLFPPLPLCVRGLTISTYNVTILYSGAKEKEDKDPYL
jgi:hypothetical protein